MKQKIVKIIFAITIGNIKKTKSYPDVYNNYNTSDILVCAENYNGDYVYFMMDGSSVRMTEIFNDNSGEINISTGNNNYINKEITELGEEILNVIDSINI